jgi:hypothetical protein
MTTCPPWCVSLHDPARGEDDWVHASEPLTLAEDATAQVVMSVDPDTGERDGPYVLMGDHQMVPEQATRAAEQLMTLTRIASESHQARE